MTRDRCRICGAEEDLAAFEVREMMFGTRERFRYFQCGSCGCLQLGDNVDLASHYPAGYYAHRATASPTGPLIPVLRRLRNRYAIRREGWIGRILDRVSPYPFGPVHRWLEPAGVGLDSRILDVGCGSGELLRDMQAVGYRRLLGADPFVEESSAGAGGVPILRRTVHEIEGEFDLVMFHHALEHIPDQHETLASAARLLAPGGECLVRIPVVSSFAWEHYREDWVQLDAPRHLFLHSRESIERVARDAGLELAEVRYDSTELQFLGSELYRRDIPLTEADGVFSRGEIQEFRKRAEALNRSARGDSAAFFFRRAGDRRGGERAEGEASR